MADTKAALLDDLRRQRAAWDALLAEVGEARMERPGVTPDWTFKDLIVHLTTWWRRRVAVLAEVARGAEPTPHPRQDVVPIINDWVYYVNRDRPLADVLRDAQSVWDAMEAAVAALPEETLFAAWRYPEFAGQALGPVMAGGFSHHLREEHEPEVRAWLARLDGAAGP